MHATLPKELLLEKLHLLEKVSGRHATLPVLQGVYMEAQDDGCLLRATNLDVGLEVRLAAEVKTSGMVVVPANTFTQLIATLPKGGTVELSQSEGFVTVKGANSTTRVKCLPVDEFPGLPKVTETEASSVATFVARDLVHGLRSVWYAASVSTIKPELASVYLYEDQGTLVFVATDSFRLAEKRIRPKQMITFTPLLLPIRNCADLVRLLDTLDGDVEVLFHQNQLSLYAGDTYFTSRLVDGSFPDYGQIVPKEFVTEVILLKQDLLATLKKTTIFSNTFSQVTFTIEPNKKKITVSTQNNEVGDMVDTLDGTIDGDMIEISFNQKYLIDSFQAITTDSVSVAFSGPGRPAIIKGVGDDSFFYLAMPMNK